MNLFFLQVPSMKGRYESRVFFLFLFSLSFLWIPCISSRPASVGHPSIRTLVERFSLGAWWAFPISRCCYPDYRPWLRFRRKLGQALGAVT